MSDALIGRRLGRVRLQRLLGEGSAGYVYLGRHQTLDRPVAVKVLKSQGMLKDRRYRERFRREARIAAQLDHPGIVRVLDYGEEDEVLYLVMDYIDGFSLGRYLRNRAGPIDELTILKILLSVAGSLQQAHQNGIVHRDLKPDNLLLSRRGSLHLADLGLARQHGATELTQEQAVVGTPAYMAPETFTAGLEVDHRVDLYALGIIGYQAAFGHLPYRGDIQQVLQGHRDGSADWSEPTTCSKRTIALLRRLLAPNREDRFQSAAELAAEVRPLYDQAARKQRKKNASNAASGTGTASSSAHAATSADFGGLVRFLEHRLSSHATTHQGGQVTHTTGRERLLVWVLLLGVIGLAVTGYVISQ